MAKKSPTFTKALGKIGISMETKIMFMGLILRLGHFDAGE